MTRPISRILFLVAGAMLFATALHAAPPVVRTINGSPLTILIGDDTAYQVLNTSIGALGQIYPGGCTNSVADAGIFAVTGGVLYAPNFGQHPCGTAVAVGPNVPWTPVSISAVSGAGTASNPFSVTVVANAGATGVQLTATYTYVNGDAYFRINKTFTATNQTALTVYTGADIYLASSDSGIPHLGPLNSPGGTDCTLSNYTILLIPTTPADHYTAQGYYVVWSEIGTQGNLSDIIGSGCQDNGAALQWQRNVPAGGSVTITSAVSFGPIPSFLLTSVSPQEACRGTDNVTVVLNGLGFQSNTTFDFGPGITVISTTINSPTQATVTLNIASTAPVGAHTVTATQAPGGLTATLTNAFTVNQCEEPCGHVTDARVRCATDGTGDYLISFTFWNDTTQPVQYLFLTAPGVTITPSVINFGTPVNPGGSAPVGPIRISGASPGPLVLTINLLDPERELCCSFEVRFELPECDCAQIVDSSGPSCRLGGGYSYTFAYQSLSAAPLQYLVLTPDTPSTAVFSPSVIPLITPMVYGEIRTFTITISNVTGGQPLCFRITAKSTECENCCSIRICIVPPRCFEDPDPIDDTVFTERTIHSPSGRPAVSFPLPPNTTRVDLAWEEIKEPLPAGSFLEQRYVGTEGVIASTRSVVRGQDTVLQTRFDAIGATRYRYEFLNDGRPVGILPDVPDEFEPICNLCGTSPGFDTVDAHFVTYPEKYLHLLEPPFEVRSYCARPGLAPCHFAAYTYRVPRDFYVTEYNLKFRADEVRVWPLDGDGGDVHLTNVEFRAQGPHSITFTDLSVTVDCNANGVDDFEDIANGTSSDFDGNGVPDECQGRGDNLDLSLNTTGDSAWRVLNTGFAGPAKAVRTPPAGWAPAFANSAWVSVREDAQSLPGISTLQFENCFCIGSGAYSATLDLDVRADNAATVFLNDRPVSATGGAFNGGPLGVLVTGRVGGEGPFRTGRNCVRVQVSDQGIATGLNVSGTVRSENGACP